MDGTKRRGVVTAWPRAIQRCGTIRVRSWLLATDSKVGLRPPLLPIQPTLRFGPYIHAMSSDLDT